MGKSGSGHYIEICASCGLVKRLGLINDGKITEEDSSPEEEFIHNKYGRAFCTPECHEYWVEQDRQAQNTVLGADQRAAMIAGIVTAKVIGTLAIKPTRRLRKIIYIL